MSDMNTRIKIDDIVIDFVAQKIYIQLEGTQLLNGSLSEKQALLIQLFVRNYPKNTTRQEIMAELWPKGFISPESVNQIINKTRKAIRDINKDKIVNDPGKGYRLGSLEFLALSETKANPEEISLYNVAENVDIQSLLNAQNIAGLSEEAKSNVVATPISTTIESNNAANGVSNNTSSSEEYTDSFVRANELLAQAGIENTAIESHGLNAFERCDGAGEGAGEALANGISENDSKANINRAEDSQTISPSSISPSNSRTPQRRASDKKKSARAMSLARQLVYVQKRFFRRRLSRRTYIGCVIFTFFNMALMSNGLYDWAYSSQFMIGIEKQPSSRFMKSYNAETHTLKGRTFKGQYFECIVDVKDKDSICHTVD